LFLNRSFLLSTSQRYKAIGAELASFALAYSLRVAEKHCLARDDVSELTNRLESYIDDVMNAGCGVTPSRSLQ
jgi:predicted peroxiredoxin